MPPSTPHFLVVPREKMHLAHGGPDRAGNEGRPAQTSLAQAPLSWHQILCKFCQRHERLGRARSESKVSYRKAAAEVVLRLWGRKDAADESCTHTAKRTAEAAQADFRLRSHLQGYHRQTWRQLLRSRNEKVRPHPNLAGTSLEARGAP